MNIKTKKMLARFLIAAGFIVAAIFFCMASTLNPWSEKLPHLDSAVWLRCAVEMKQGKVIYRDVWDHKGPILFAIQVLGLTITPHSLNGIWLLECLFCFTTLWSFYLTASLVSHNKLVCFLAAVCSMHPVYYFFQEGNCVEEWALPLIGFSLYYFAKYMKTGKLIRRDIFVAGFLMGCSFLLNGNLIAVWICYALFIFVKQIWQKQFQEFKCCAIFFISGFLAVSTIVMLILFIQGAFGSFINAYFGFNYGYVSGVTLESFKHSVLNFVFRDNWLVYSHMILFFLLVHDRNIKGWLWSAFFYTGITLILISVSGRGYVHYGLQLLPCMIIPMAVCIERIRAWCSNFKEFLLIIIIVGIMVVRFEVLHYEQLIRWTISTKGDNYYAGGDPENYTIVNEWIGNRWNEEALKKWVIDESVE